MIFEVRILALFMAIVLTIPEIICAYESSPREKVAACARFVGYRQKSTLGLICADHHAVFFGARDNEKILSNSWIPKLPNTRSITSKDDPTIVMKLSAAEEMVLGWPVDINSATSADLQRLPQIGERLAGQIIDHRQRLRGFESVDDLLGVRGIGPKKLNALRPYVDVSFCRL